MGVHWELTCCLMLKICGGFIRTEVDELSDLVNGWDLMDLDEFSDDFTVPCLGLGML